MSFDQDNTTIYDFLEIGQVPSITLNLDAISIAAVDASKTLVVSGTAPDFSVEPTYYNWSGSNPDESGNEDWMDMRLGDGGWNDNRNNRNYRWIVEFNTLDPVIPDDEINNYDLLTTYNGHAYYISKTGARPHWANIYARNTGGYLTFINDAAENEILRSSASTYVHGYDNTSSNTRVWIGIYQNNSSPKFVEKAGGWESYPMPSTVNYQWQISSDSVNWSDITAANNLFLLNDTTITLSNYNTDQLGNLFLRI